MKTMKDIKIQPYFIKIFICNGYEVSIYLVHKNNIIVNSKANKNKI